MSNHNTKERQSQSKSYVNKCDRMSQFPFVNTLTVYNLLFTYRIAECFRYGIRFAFHFFLHMNWRPWWGSNPPKLVRQTSGLTRDLHGHVTLRWIQVYYVNHNDACNSERWYFVTQGFGQQFYWRLARTSLYPSKSNFSPLLTFLIKIIYKVWMIDIVFDITSDSDPW